MIKTIAINGLLFFISLSLLSCKDGQIESKPGLTINQPNVSIIKMNNTVGEWHHEISKVMGGNKISATSILTISSNEPNNYQYNLETTVIDEMYGGNPNTISSKGKMEAEGSNGKWLFTGGDFGDRGAYISVPTDKWDDYKPSVLNISFISGRGNPMAFIK